MSMDQGTQMTQYVQTNERQEVRHRDDKSDHGGSIKLAEDSQIVQLSVIKLTLDKGVYWLLFW